jgi:hypothetical protein
MATRRVSELDRFLTAPALPPRALGRAGGGWINYDIVVAVCGVRGIQVRDPALYDAVSIKYDRRCETFAQAFAACLRGRRSLANIDLATLRECHPAFEALQLPETIDDAQMAAQIGDWFERAANGAPLAEPEAPEPAPPAPPARRPPPLAVTPLARMGDLEEEIARIRARHDALVAQRADAEAAARRAAYMGKLRQYLRAQGRGGKIGPR